MREGFPKRPVGPLESFPSDWLCHRYLLLAVESKQSASRAQGYPRAFNPSGLQSPGTVVCISYGDHHMTQLLPTGSTSPRALCDFAAYPPATQAYLQAHDYASRMLKNREILAFSVSHCTERGRLIYVESDQGWNPDPLFEEFPLDQDLGPPN